MRKVIKEVQVYKFEELSYKAKEKVKEGFLNDPLRISDFMDICKDRLEVYFPHSSLDIQFSLNCCQGDGFNIHGDLDFQDILIFINNKDFCTCEFKPFYGCLDKAEQGMLKDYLSCGMDAISLPSNNRYRYCIAHKAEFADEWHDSLCLKQEGMLPNRAVLEKAENLVRSLFVELSANFELFGYKYLYEISEHEAMSIAEGNDMEFLEDGSVFHGN